MERIATIVEKARKRRKAKARFGRQVQSRIEAQSKPLASQVAAILRRMAVREAKRLAAEIKRKPIKVSKAGDDLLDPSKDLLVKFHLRQLATTGKATAEGLGSAWELEPRILQDIIESKEILVQQIAADSDRAVKESLKAIRAQAQRETPQPSVGEIARRIRTQFHGRKDSGGQPSIGADGKPIIIPVGNARILPTDVHITSEGKQLYAFSPERAALIARTEMVQTENDAIFQGMAVAGVEAMEWLARTDGRSGGRHHERMNKHKPISTKDLKGNDPTKWFELPSGARLRFPGDPLGPIGETAN